MNRTKITSKYQTTIPKKIRQALNIKIGDDIIFKLIDGNKVLIQKLNTLDKRYLESLDSTLSEWNSEEDDEAFEEKMKRLVAELAGKFKKSHELEGEIKKNLKGLGYEA